MLLNLVISLIASYKMQMENSVKKNTQPSKAGKKQRTRKRKPKATTQQKTITASPPPDAAGDQSPTNHIENLSEQLPSTVTENISKVVESTTELIVSIVTTDMKKIIPTTNKEHAVVEREHRRLSKQLEKQKILDKSRNLDDGSAAREIPEQNHVENASTTDLVDGGAEKSREQVMAERELKRQAKLAAKKKGKQSSGGTVTALAAAVGDCAPSSSLVSGVGGDAKQSESSVSKKLEDLSISAKCATGEKQAPTKAERRAKQEAQRAAKAKLLEAKSAAAANIPSQTSSMPPQKSEISDSRKTLVPSHVKKSTSLKISSHRVKLFNHLYIEDHGIDQSSLSSIDIHPAIRKLGAQYASRVIVGANARCLSFMSAMRNVIQDYKTPPQKEFSRGLEESIQPGLAYLHRCRPLAVSVSNAAKFIKWQITQLPADESDSQLKERLLESIDTYIRDQIEKAAQAISITVQEKISNGDVILTFGCSSLITHILDEAQLRHVDFRVVVVNARPDNEGVVMLERLVAKGIRCSFVMINAIGFIMPEVTKVLLGVHALLANGYVMARTGTAQVALVAKTYNVPVLVCCETHKFSERVQTDAFVYNELGNPSDIVLKSKQPNALSNWESLQHLTPLNLKYDITPPELVTAVVTEVAILPCTSVPVILRIKPSEIGY